MSKRDQIMARDGANMMASLGVGSARPAHGPDPKAAAAKLNSPRYQGVKNIKTAFAIPIESLIPDPSQPRKEFDEEGLGDLAASMDVRGQLQPITVRWVESEQRYMIVSGERRWRAAQRIGMPTLDCLVRDGEVTEAELQCIQLVENCSRADLTPLEMARALRALKDQTGWSNAQLGKEIGMKEQGIGKILKMLETPQSVQDLVAEEKLPPAHAYAVSKLADPEAQVELAWEAVEQNLTRDEVEQRVRQRQGPSRDRTKAKATRIPRPDRWEWTTPGGTTIRLVGPEVVTGRQALIVALEEAIQQVREDPTLRDIEGSGRVNRSWREGAGDEVARGRADG